MKRLCTLLLALCALTARAQTPAPADADLAARIDSLSAEVAALRTESNTWKKILARLPRISGYVQTGFDYSDNVSDFRIKRVRLTLDGDILRDKLSYRAQFELAAPRIVDAFVEYRPLEELRIKLGQYKLPFSIENTEYSPLRCELIEYPLAIQRLVASAEQIGGQTINATGREMGLTLSGGFIERNGRRIVSYDIGLYNGAGINVRDNNRSKDILARLMLRPADGLLFSGSYYRGEFGPEYLKRERYAAGACYDRGAVVLRGEWVGGRTGRTEADGGDAFDSSGWYVLGGWRPHARWTVVARYDTLLADTAAHDSRQTNYSAGITWQPLKWLRGQLNYTYEEYKISAAKNRHVGSVLLTAMF